MIHAGSRAYAGSTTNADRELLAGRTRCAGCGRSAFKRVWHCNMPVKRNLAEA